MYTAYMYIHREKIIICVYITQPSSFSTGYTRKSVRFVFKKFQNVEEMQIIIQQGQTIHKTAIDRERRQTNNQTENWIRGEKHEMHMIKKT